MLYAYAWYLDLVSPGWEALVVDGYSAVMPLPVRKKWGISYLFRPPYCQQLGLFSSSPASSELLDACIAAIPEKIRLMDLPLNESNMALREQSRYRFSERDTYLLPLDRNYDELYNNYSTNARRNLDKALRLGLQPQRLFRPESLLGLKWENSLNPLPQEYKVMLTGIWDKLSASGEAEIHAIHGNDGRLEAGALFIHSEKRWVYLLSASSPAGKSHRAMFLLIDHFIRGHAGEPVTLDFEGSILPDLARFFAGFGAVRVPYLCLHINRLPLPFRLIRKLF